MPTLVGLFPHTHVRGKRWSYTLELPDGTTKSILSVPRYDFNWQTYYMYRGADCRSPRARASARPRGTTTPRRIGRIPIPTIDVKWGDQTWEEMQYTGIMYSSKKVKVQRSKSKVSSKYATSNLLSNFNFDLCTYFRGP